MAVQVQAAVNAAFQHVVNQRIGNSIACTDLGHSKATDLCRLNGCSRRNEQGDEAAARQWVLNLRCTQAYPAAGLKRCLDRCVDHSPIDALVHLVVRCRLRRQIPVWFDLGTLTPLRIKVLPHRRSTRWCDVWRLRLHPDVIEHVPDIGAVRDEGDDAHLPTADGAQQREHLVDSGDHHRPEVVRL